MKRRLFVALLLLMLFTSVHTVHADMGPKPSMEVTIKGVTEDYYFDVLVNEGDGDLLTEIDVYDYYREISQSLINYKDSEGYYSYSIYEIPSSIKRKLNTANEQKYLLNYHRPDHFKLVLVLEESEKIISSQAIDIVGFNVEIAWDLSGVDLNSTSTGDVGVLSGDIDGEISFVDSIGFSTMINTALRMIITIIVEVGILLLFGIRTKKAIKLVVVVNAATNLMLGGVLICIYQTSGPLAFYFMTLILEMIVLLMELVIYSVTLKKIPFWKILTYTIVANIVTFLIGLRFILII
jgi:hypothetical protein